MRAGMRDRMLASPLCDGPSFVRDLEFAYRKIWRDYCAGRPPTGAGGESTAPPAKEGQIVAPKETPPLPHSGSSGSSAESPTSSLFLRTDDSGGSSGGSLEEMAEIAAGRGKTPSRLRNASS